MESPPSRVILNANRGLSNVIEQKVINTDLRRVTNNLFNVLKHHYGPYSGFAAKDDGQPLNEPVFTKDGIGIVRAIQYASPQEEWVRKNIAYIGTRMESSVGDGTTSAMMFTCGMLKHMSEHIDELKPISYNKFKNEFSDFVTLVKARLAAKYTLKPENADGSLNGAKVHTIVYNQVYTSSHGNRDLALALAKMYASVPPEQWERMVYERCRYETDKDYEVVQSTGQYQMRAEVMTTSMLNKDLCTRFEKENCTVFIANDSLRQESPDWNKIIKAIDESTADKSVVILCHTQMDENTYQTINEKINECDKAGRPFAIFTCKPDNPKVNDFIALQAICGVDITKFANGDAVRVDGVTVTYKDKKLAFDHLVEVPEGYTSNERHHVTDGKHSQFTDILETWKNQADWFTKNGTSRTEREMANYFNRMYIKLRYNKTYTVVVGGKAYDNVAFVDVLDDAIRAASRALTHGITLGNNRSLYLISNAIIKEGDCNMYRRWFAERIVETLRDMGKVVLERTIPGRWFPPWIKNSFVDWWFSHSVDLLHYDQRIHTDCGFFRSNWDTWNDFKRVDSPTFNMSDSVVINIVNQSGRIICQPANSDIIMLERFGEVALKFILTERIIIKDGVYVDKKR